MSGVELIKGDITKLEVMAIVNAANSSLLGGGGVDGAIHRVGGPKILEECRAIRDRQGGCATGEAVITSGGNLKAKFVIHTVGPVWNGGSRNEDQLLANAYTNSMKLAAQHNVTSIAFPNISTGIYNFPKERAAAIAIRAVEQSIKQVNSIERVIFCCFDDGNFSIYHTLLEEKL